METLRCLAISLHMRAMGQEEIVFPARYPDAASNLRAYRWFDAKLREIRTLREREAIGICTSQIERILRQP